MFYEMNPRRFHFCGTFFCRNVLLTYNETINILFSFHLLFWFLVKSTFHSKWKHPTKSKKTMNFWQSSECVPSSAQWTKPDGRKKRREKKMREAGKLMKSTFRAGGDGRVAVGVLFLAPFKTLNTHTHALTQQQERDMERGWECSAYMWMAHGWRHELPLVLLFCSVFSVVYFFFLCSHLCTPLGKHAPMTMFTRP